MQAKYIAKALSGGDALAFRWLEDGGMRVLCRDGRKLTFTSFQVRQAVDKTQDSGDTIPVFGDKLPESGEKCAPNVEKTPGTMPVAVDKDPIFGDESPAVGGKVPESGDKVPESGDNPARRARRRRQP